jgi:hypothetical protein
MKRIRKIIILPIILLIIFLIIIGIYFFYIKQTKASIFIETVPNAEVYINDEKQGRTPFEGEFAANEITLKLVPESFDTPLIPYETKVKLVSGVTTIVRREFSEEEEGDSGEEISYEKLGGNQLAISVISKPDGAKVYVDNKFIDLSPAKITDLSPGEHELVVKADTYKEQKFKVVSLNGYGITAIVELAVDKNAQAETESDSETVNSESDESSASAMVEIKDTPTGFLRVRSGPTTGDPEVGQVKPGEKYELIDTDETSGWYKIKYDDGEGWISNDYATKQDDTEK